MLMPFVLFAVLILYYPTAQAESTTNKCTDGKQITYANMPCEKLGLTSAGKIKDAVTVVPATPKAKTKPPENSDSAQSEGKDVAAAVVAEGDADVDMPAPVKIKPVNPLIEKLMRWP